MKGRLFFEILAVLIIILMCAGFIMLKQYFSTHMFEEGIPVVSTRSEQLTEMRVNILEKVENVEERLELVENMIRLGQITPEEGDFLLGVTESL